MPRVLSLCAVRMVVAIDAVKIRFKSAVHLVLGTQISTLSVSLVMRFPFMNRGSDPIAVLLSREPTLKFDI